MEPFLSFLSRSPTAWHAAREISSTLLAHGFLLLQEDEPWQLTPGHSYFMIRDGTLLAAFRLPQKKPRQARLLASHLDSPALKLKPRPERSVHAIEQFSTEVYGTPLLHSWLDRELAIAGQVVTRTARGTLQQDLVFLQDTPLILPQLAIHLDRAVQEKGILIHKQDHLHAIAALHPHPMCLETLLKRHLSFEQLVSFDLFLVPLQPPQTLGLEGELLAGYRLDNLSSAHASLNALCASSASEETLLATLFWDHEEIGSQTHLGADSQFVDELFERIAIHSAMSREEFFQMKHRSLAISADLAHGFHPNYADRYDPLNAPFLGRGVVLKYNANQRYATSAFSAALILQIAEKNQIPTQTFASRSDIPSGSTVGPIMAARVGIPTLDLGIASWAMHSAREVIACEDQRSLTSLLTHILENS